MRSLKPTFAVSLRCLAHINPQLQEEAHSSGLAEVEKSLSTVHDVICGVMITFNSWPHCVEAADEFNSSVSNTPPRSQQTLCYPCLYAFGPAQAHGCVTHEFVARCIRVLNARFWDALSL